MDSNCNYSFTALFQGTYIVVETNPRLYPLNVMEGNETSNGKSMDTDQFGNDGFSVTVWLTITVSLLIDKVLGKEKSAVLSSVNNYL